MTTKATLGGEHKLPLIRSQSQQQPASQTDMMCLPVERCEHPRIIEEGEYGENKWTVSLSTQDQSRAESSPQLCRKDSCNRGVAVRVAQCYGSTNELMPMLGSIDNMSTTCNVGLLRSMSARTVDSLPGLESSASGSGSDPKFLLQLPADASNMTCRSTSCPSMAYPPFPMRSPSHQQSEKPGDPTAPHSHCGYSYVNDNRDVNLEGEVISDLPVLFDPTQNFPDIIPELQLETARPSILAMTSGITLNDNDDHRRLCQKYELSKQYISIGELPSGVAKGVITDTKPTTAGTTVQPVDVTEKCMMWLDTLSLSDNS